MLSPPRCLLRWRETKLSAYQSDITDFLTKKQLKNEGEVPQYYLAGNHEPIIASVVWDFTHYQRGVDKLTGGYAEVSVDATINFTFRDSRTLAKEV